MIKFEVKNRFTGAIQFTAELDCAEDQQRSVKLGLSVRWALKAGADLSDAYLRGAYLRGADLSGAYLIHLGQRSDGYDFLAHIKDGAIWIKAGCRHFTITDASKHWRDTRDGTQLGNESMQFLKQARALVKIRGMLS